MRKVMENFMVPVSLKEALAEKVNQLSLATGVRWTKARLIREALYAFLGVEDPEKKGAVSSAPPTAEVEPSPSEPATVNS